MILDEIAPVAYHCIIANGELQRTNDRGINYCFLGHDYDVKCPHYHRNINVWNDGNRYGYCNLEKKVEEK